VCGAALFTALMIRFFVQLGKGVPVRTASEKGFAFVDILIISVTLIVVAVPEGALNLLYPCVWLADSHKVYRSLLRLPSRLQRSA
jgi:P-type Ca2+ transporter type 2C